MRLIVNHPDFPFRRDTRTARAVDLGVLVLLAALVSDQVIAPAPAPAPPAPPPATAYARQAVLVLHADGRWTLDGQVVPPDDLAADLTRYFAGRTVRTLFIAPHAERPYGDVQRALKAARAAGVTAGLLPPGALRP